MEKQSCVQILLLDLCLASDRLFEPGFLVECSHSLGFVFIDLENFFPSINFGRVRGLFMSEPFNVPQAGATILAQLCCHRGVLPQGAPTSPVISNIICSRLDRQLMKLAQSHNCFCTRYADDITFSKTRTAFPAEIGYFD